MAKLTAMITRKVRSCLFLLAAFTEQGPLVADRVLGKLRPRLEEGEEPPPFLAQIQALGRLLKASLDEMVELDRKLYEEKVRRATLIEERDEIAGVLGGKITSLRRIVLGHYPDAKVGSLGLEGRTVREPIALLRQSELICEKLQRADLEELLGDPSFDPPPDIAHYARQAEVDIGRLRDAYEVHQRSRRRVATLRRERKEAIKLYDTAFLRVARQFEDLCRLAGEDELADRVRPSLSHPGETLVEPEGAEVAEPLEGADEAREASALEAELQAETAGGSTFVN